MLQDAHIHLQNASTEAMRIIDGASARDIGRFFCNGTAPSDWDDLSTLARSSEKVIPFYGVHPWYCAEADDGWDVALRQNLANPLACIGEIGLDSVHDGPGIIRQREIFTRQLDIAFEMKRPFAVHCVQAWDTLLEELRLRGAGGQAFMIHWFSGSPEIAAELVRRGAYLSFSPRLLYARAKKHRAAFDATPVERILLETDYPYLPDAVTDDIAPAEKYFEWLTALYGYSARLKSMDEKSFIDKVWENGTIFLHRTSHR